MDTSLPASFECLRMAVDFHMLLFLDRLQLLTFMKCWKLCELHEVSNQSKFWVFFFWV